MILFMSSLLNPTGEWNQLKTEDAVLIEYKIQEYHDVKNDQHVEYVVYKLTNLSNEEVEVSFVHKFDLNDETKTSNRDGQNVVTIPANGSVEGDVQSEKSLTMFRRFLPGNSGKVASPTKYTNHNLNIIQKK